MEKTSYTIIKTAQFYGSLKSIPSSVKNSIVMIEPMMEKDPYSVAKPLRKPFEGKYVVRLLDRKYRLVCRIENQTHKVYFDYVRSRSRVYLS